MPQPNIVHPPGSLDLYTLTDLDQVPLGESFEVTWAIRNNGDTVWTDDYSLVYTDESHADAIPVPHSNLAGRDAIPVADLGASGKTAPGQTLYLTLALTAPETPGAYFTGWQLQSPAGERAGPLAELRVIAIEPPDKGLGDYSYQSIRYQSGVPNRNSLSPGEKFSGTWHLRHTGFKAWEGDFRAVYTAEKVEGSLTATADPMGNPASQSLWTLSRKQRLNPGEEFTVTFNFVAPAASGFYAFHWQMVDPDGVAFGGTRWMAIIVADPIGQPPTPPSLPGGGAGYVYRGPAVTFFTGIHGPADDWQWQNGRFQEMIRRLNMPIFFMSHGINHDFRHMGDPARNVVRLVWNPRPISADAAYEEIRDDALGRWWSLGYRRFVFFNEPQLTEVNGISKEGFNVAWHSAEEFARFLKTCLTRARSDFPGIFLYSTPMTTNAAFDPWRWYGAMWAEVKHLVDGWCMHAYSGNNTDAGAAANDIASEILEVQRRLGIQVPIIVSEASINRGSDAAQKARAARVLHDRLRHAPGVHGVYWFAADWAPDQDAHNEGWFSKGIADAYLAQQV